MIKRRETLARDPVLRPVVKPERKEPKKPKKVWRHHRWAMMLEKYDELFHGRWRCLRCGDEWVGDGWPPWNVRCRRIGPWRYDKTGRKKIRGWYVGLRFEWRGHVWEPGWGVLGSVSEPDD